MISNDMSIRQYSLPVFSRNSAEMETMPVEFMMMKNK